MKTKKESGGARMKRHGKRPILLGVTDAEKAELDAAAVIERRPTTQFILSYALAAAKKILKKVENNH